MYMLSISVRVPAHHTNKLLRHETKNVKYIEYMYYKEPFVTTDVAIRGDPGEE